MADENSAAAAKDEEEEEEEIIDLRFESPVEEAEEAAGEPISTSETKEVDPDNIEPSAKKADETAAPIRHQASMLRTARNLGIAEDRIGSLSPEQLDVLCDALMEKQEAEAAEAESKKTATEEVDDDAFDLGAFGESLDPDFVALLKKNHDKQVEKRKLIEKTLERVTQAEAKQHQQTVIQQIDAGFAALNSPLLGGNAGREAILQKPQEMKRRMLVISSLQSEPVLVNGNPVAVADAIRIRAKELFGLADNETPVNGNLDEKKKKWAAAGTSVPTTRAEKLPKGDAAAVKAVGKWLKDNQMEDDDELAVFPDASKRG